MRTSYLCILAGFVLGVIFSAVAFPALGLVAVPGGDADLSELWEKGDPYLIYTVATIMRSGDTARRIPVNVMFVHQLSEEEIGEMESLGLQFIRVNGQILHTGPIYSANATVDALFALARSDLVVRIEHAKPPESLP